MKRLPIRARLFVSMMAVIVGFLALTYATTDRLVSQFLQAELTREMDRARDAYHSSESLRATLLAERARSLAQVPHLRAVLGTPDVDEPTIAYTLASLVGPSGSKLLLLADAEGRLLADGNAGLHVDDAAHAQTDLSQSLARAERVGYWRYDGRLHHVAVEPVTIADQVLGFLLLGEPVGAEAAADYRDATGLDVLVIQDGTLVAVACDDAQLADLCSLVTSQALPLPDERSQVTLGSDVFLVERLPMQGTDATLVLARPLERTLALFRAAKRSFLLGASCIGLIAFVVSQRISRRLGQPIRQLSAAAGRLAHGDLSASVPVEREDELGTLARAFNAMAREIETLVGTTLEKARAAEQASEAKSAFLATMSHELRTPLNGILGATDLLLGAAPRPEQEEELRAIERSGQDLLGLVGEVLDLARIESGQMEVLERAFRPALAIEATLRTFRPELAAKGLTASVTLDPSLPEVLIGDRGRIQQILRNYLGNAIKFTPRGSVSVAARLEDGPQARLLRLEVRDTGIGIRAADLPRLFRPFSQLDSSFARRYQGSGLGLAVCKELAELLGGSVGVESEPDRGSLFWATVRVRAETGAPRASCEAHPRAAEELAPALPAGASPPSAACAQARARERILIVEDNPLNLRIAEKVVRRAGWSCRTAGDGRSALEVLASEPIDLVLMDCQMPVMDGFEATRRIRSGEVAGTEHLPIVGLTANVLPGDRERCLAGGMDDFLAKPFRAAELVLVLERWLADPARRRVGRAA